MLQCRCSAIDIFHYFTDRKKGRRKLSCWEDHSDFTIHSPMLILASSGEKWRNIEKYRESGEIYCNSSRTKEKHMGLWSRAKSSGDFVQ